MKASNNIFRAVARRSPEAIYVAEKTCIAQIWVPSHTISGDANGVAMIATELDPDYDWGGTPLPFNTVIKVLLERGQSLYVMSKEEAEVSVSVVTR